MRAMEPTELLFWGVMSLGVMAGFALAYPVNVWMVKQGIKHGLVTERRLQDDQHLQHGGHVAHQAAGQQQHGKHQHDHGDDNANHQGGDHHAHHSPASAKPAFQLTRTELAAVPSMWVQDSAMT